MKKSLSVLSALVAASLMLGSADAATSAQTASKEMQDALGTWHCKSSAGNHTATFTSMLGGKGMRISETGMGSGSEDLIVFDAKRQKWIDEHADAQSYGVMEGASVKDGINFTLVYPSGQNAKFSVRFPAKNKQVSTYTGTMNGKTFTEHETCTKS